MEDSELGIGKTCFVVTPIGNPLAPLGTEGRDAYERSLEMWAKVFSPACEHFGLRAVRADKIADPGELPDQIFTYLRDADVVIADVSGGNPNVMYELGLRHSKHATTIQIGEYGRLPFDVQSIRTIQFKRDEMGLIEARNSLMEALRSALISGPVAFRATEVFTDGVGPIVNPDVDSLRSDAPTAQYPPSEPGLLEIMAEGEDALTHVVEVLGSITNGFQEVAAVSASAGEKIQTPPAGTKPFAWRLTVARGLAGELKPLADEMRSDSAQFASDVRHIDAMLKQVFARADEADASELTQFLDNVEEMLNSAETSVIGIMNMRESVKLVSTLSRDLRPVSDTLDHALAEVISSIRVMLDWRESTALARAHAEP